MFKLEMKNYISNLSVTYNVLKDNKNIITATRSYHFVGMPVVMLKEN